jgi:hypothetical protein
LRRIWLFSANKIKSSESFSKQPTQLIVELNSSLQQIIDTLECSIVSSFCVSARMFLHEGFYTIVFHGSTNQGENLLLIREAQNIEIIIERA